jgi:hypothetical protein
MKIQENIIGKPAEKRQRKTLLARDLAIMISKSLLLFNKVYEVGFSYFCLKYGVIATKEDMPHRTTISRDALDDIWHEMAHVFLRVTSEPL